MEAAMGESRCGLHSRRLLLAAALLSVAEALHAAERAPLSKTDPSSLFTPVHRSGPGAPNNHLLDGKGAKPTNAWWESAGMIITEGEQREGMLFQMPYQIVPQGSAVLVYEPWMGASPNLQYTDPGFALKLGTLEGLNGMTVNAWDELTVTLNWRDPAPPGVAGRGMSLPLARGAPYVTAEYSGVTPKLSSETLILRPNGGVLVDGKKMPCDGNQPLTGTVFSVDLFQSDTLWLVFAPAGSSWICRDGPFSLTAAAPVNGAVRLALAGNCTSGKGQHHCEGAPQGRDASAYTGLLQAHAACYPKAGTVDYVVDGDVGTVTWDWTTNCLSGWPQQPLLQLAYPVHLPLLHEDVRQVTSGLPATPFKDLRGSPAPVVGNTWVMTYELFPDVGLAAPRAVDQDMKAELLNSLKGDKGAKWSGTAADRDYDLPLNFQLGVGDTYFSGKMLARLARLIVIADELGESKEPYFAEMVERLASRLEVWLDPAKAPAPFLYDVAWGGVISCGCQYEDCNGACTPHCRNSVSPPENCPAVSDAGMNFGNGFYNDHHFHYGYFVFAAAAVAKYNPSWEQKWREPLLAIIRDYANPSTADESFPLVRHKDWFLGFSWAGGVHTPPPPLGRNQESTSEAINGYYALYAYGSAVDAPFARDLRDLGRILTAMEVHSADTYWHIRADSAIYRAGFQHLIVGILWEQAVEFQTWFGSAPYVVSGIQLLPMTPAMEPYLKPDWVAEHVGTYKAACEADAKCHSGGWAWPLCLELAVLDKVAARECLEGLPDDAFDSGSPASNGNSLTNALHWIATRPDQARKGPLLL